MLAALDQIDWHQLQHAQGPADDIPFLLRQLASPHPLLASDAVKQLQELAGTPGTLTEATPWLIPFLVELATEPSVTERGALVDWLTRLLGTDPWTTTGRRVREASSISNWQRATVARIHESWPQLARLVLDTDPGLRSAAAILLGVLGRDGDALLGTSALEASIPGFLDLLATTLGDEPEPAVQAARLVAVGLLAQTWPTALEIVQAWQEPTHPLAWRALATWQLIESLVTPGDPEIRLLIEALLAGALAYSVGPKVESLIRTRVLELREQGWADLVLKVATEAFRRGPQDQRCRALDLLGAFLSADYFAEHLEDPDPLVRAHVAARMYKEAPASAPAPLIEVMRELLRSPDPQVRQVVCSASQHQPTLHSDLADDLLRLAGVENHPLVRTALTVALTQLAPRVHPALAIVLRWLNEGGDDDVRHILDALAQGDGLLQAAWPFVRDNLPRFLALYGPTLIGMPFLTPVSALVVPMVWDFLFREENVTRRLQWLDLAFHAHAPTTRLNLASGLLEVLQKDGSAWLRQRAAKQLGKLVPLPAGYRDALVHAFLNDAEVTVREAALVALGQYAPTPAMIGLFGKRLLEEPLWVLRRHLFGHLGTYYAEGRFLSAGRWLAEGLKTVDAKTHAFLTAAIGPLDRLHRARVA